MNATDIINTWGVRKYGKSGAYSLELGVGGYVSDVTDASEGVIRVYRDAKQIDEIDGMTFQQVLNEILGVRA